MKSLLSPGYIAQPSVSCFRLLTHWIWRALSLARLSAGSSMAARMAMMAITTSNSMRVKARREFIISENRHREWRFVLSQVRSLFPFAADFLHDHDHLTAAKSVLRFRRADVQMHLVVRDGFFLRDLVSAHGFGP